MNLFPALTAPPSLVFLSNLSNTDEVALVANLGKTSLVEGTARNYYTNLPKLSIFLPRNLFNSINLYPSTYY